MKLHIPNQLIGKKTNEITTVVCLEQTILIDGGDDVGGDQQYYYTMFWSISFR
jgi:hypothetical protein